MVATVNPNIARKVSRMPGVRAAVRGERDKLAGVAEGLFASHDHPGGHRITKQNGRTDAFVSLDGPAPLSVEFGHWTDAKKPADRRFVEGLHVLTKAIAQAAE